MGIIYHSQSPGRAYQTTSAYGSVPFSSDTARIFAYIPPGGGTVWNAYRYQNPGLNPGESLNVIRVAGGHDFLVGGGGSGVVRVANCVWRMGKAWPADFISLPLDGTIGYVYGTGVGANVVVDCSKAGFTTNDIIAGNCYLGFAVGTDSNDVALGNGTYRNAVMDWTIYTGSDSPGTAPTTPTGALIPGPGNANPGKSPGQQFANTQANYTGPNSSFLDFWWSITLPNGIAASGITFAATGTNTYRDQKGTSRPLPPDGRWWHSDSGLLNVALNAVPGDYHLRCFVDPGMSGFPAINLAASLTIPLTGGWHPSEA